MCLDVAPHSLGAGDILLCIAGKHDVYCCTYRELLNHQKCAGHPNVVAIRDVFLTRNHLALVLEYANDGDLSQVISRHLVSQVRFPSTS